MTNTQALETIIRESGLKKSYIADALNITGYALAKKIRNESEFKASEIDKLCQILKIVDFDEVKRIFFANRVD